MDWWEVKQFLYDWQTLVGTCLATLAAVATVFVLQQSNRHLRSQAREQRRRRLMACRAVMPADLSTINRYVVECTNVVCEAIEAVKNEEVGVVSLAAPVLPDRVVQNLQNLVEWLDRDDAEKVADLIACYQVQNSRLLTEIERFNDPNRFGMTDIFDERNVTMMMIERTVELSMRTVKMYEFARRKTAVDHLPQMRFTEDDLQSALFNLRLDRVLGEESLKNLRKDLVT